MTHSTVTSNNIWIFYKGKKTRYIHFVMTQLYLTVFLLLRQLFLSLFLPFCGMSWALRFLALALVTMIHSLLSVNLNGTYCETDVPNYSLAQWKRILKKIKKHAITIIDNVSLVYSVRIFLCPVGNQNHWTFQSLVNQALFAKFYQAKLSVPSDSQFQKQAGVNVFVWIFRLIHRSYLSCSMFSKTPVALNLPNTR